MSTAPHAEFTRFNAGRGLAIVFPPTYVVVDPTNGVLAAKLWATLEAEGGVDELLDVFLAEGLKELGDFAMAQVEADGVRVVVRGQTTAIVSDDLTKLLLEAGTVKTWVEALYPTYTGFALSLGVPTEHTLTYRVERGIVPADEIHCGDIHRGPADLAGAGLDRAQDFESIPTAPIGVSAVPTLNILKPPQKDASEHLSDRSDDDQHLDGLFGQTVAKSVADAAVSPPEEELESPAARSDAAPRLASDETLTPPQDTRTAEGLIDSIPGPPPMPSDNLPSTHSPDDRLGDHDGRTVSKTQLDRLRSQPEAMALTTQGVGVTVPAILCPIGHPNPTKSAICRKCRQPLNAAVTTIPRPVLGSLVFTNGMRIELDRPVLIGRNPKISEGMLGEVPRSVRLEDEEAVSRTHAIVRLESWHVIVEDLGSKFGTVLTQPGQDSRRLAKSEQVILEPGAVIDFAETVSATFQESG